MIFEPSKGAVVRGNHCVYQITYHLVLVAYRRRKVLPDEVASYMINLSAGMLEKWGGKLIKAKADRDHLHMLISIPPKYSLSTCIGTIKQVTAKRVQREFQYLRILPQNGRLWSSSFYISTVGETDVSIVKQYIQHQGENE